MQATGLKTAQPAYNRDLLGILLAVVVLAAVVTALIIVTSGQPAQARPGAAPAPDANAITQSRVQFFAEEHSTQASPNVLTPRRVRFFADEKGSQASGGSVSGRLRMIPN
jgi:hypothetical protein